MTVVSPDSNRVSYTAWHINKSDLVLYQVPILGGTPQKILVEINSAVAFLPDGERIAFVHSAPSQKRSHLTITKADGTERKILAERQFPETFEAFFSSPAWSPDGKSIVAVGASMTMGAKSSLLVFDTENGTRRNLTETDWSQIEQIAWQRDGSSLLMIARAESSHPKQIWRVAYPTGETQKITNDLNDYRGLSLTKDSEKLVTTQIEQTARLWVSPGDEPEKAKPILSESGSNANTEGLAWTPDGKIIFRFAENGQNNIWQIGKDGSGRRQLTTGSDNIHPAACADDSIIFVSKRTGAYRLWRMNSDGGNPQMINEEGDDSQLYPHCAVGANQAVYQNGWRRSNILKIHPAGDDSSPVTEMFSIRPAVSPDGKLVAYF